MFSSSDYHSVNNTRDVVDGRIVVTTTTTSTTTTPAAAAAGAPPGGEEINKLKVGSIWKHPNRNAKKDEETHGGDGGGVILKDLIKGALVD